MRASISSSTVASRLTLGIAMNEAMDRNSWKQIIDGEFKKGNGSKVELGVILVVRFYSK